MGVSDADKATANRDHDGMGAVVDPKFLRKTSHVHLHRILGDGKAERDFLIPQTFSDKLKHFQFSRGKALASQM